MSLSLSFSLSLGTAVHFLHLAFDVCPHKLSPDSRIIMYLYLPPKLGGRIARPFECFTKRTGLGCSTRTKLRVVFFFALEAVD